MHSSSLVERNPSLNGFVSLDGGERYGIVDLFEGAPLARKAGRPTSLAAEYAYEPHCLPRCAGPMPLYADWLPYLRFPSLGEGGTPLVPMPRAATSTGLGAVWLKREAANPTGSHKDRMTPLAVARALEIGAPGVACASSGNAAVSLAAYAAAAGLPCRVVVTTALTDPFRRILERMGALLDVVPSPLARWERLGALVAQGWFPVTNYALPAAGSNPFGNQGYRTVAFELWQQAGALDAVLVPTARGDLVWGIGDGYRALARAKLMDEPMPRLIVVEPFPRVSKVLAGMALASDRFPGSTRQFSTAGATTTDQAVRAVRDSGGTAIAIGDALASAAQASLALAGHDLELCAAAAFAALPELLKSGVIATGMRVAVIGTAASTREPSPILPDLVPNH